MLIFFFNNLILIISILLISFLVFFSWKLARKFYPIIVLVDFVFFFIFIKLILYIIVPYTLGLFNGNKFLIQDDVPISLFIRLHMIELVSWLFWSIAFLFTGLLLYKKNILNKFKTEIFLKQKFNENLFYLLFCTIGFIIIRAFNLFQIQPPFYLEVFKSLFFYVGLASGPFLIVLSHKFDKKYYFIIGLLSTLFSLLSLSTKGSIIYLTIYFAFLIWYLSKSSFVKKLFFKIIFIVAFAFILFGTFANFSVSIDENGTVNFEVKNHFDKSSERSFIEEIEWRLGASMRNGTGFIKMFDRGELAGINPIKNSFLGILPRSLNEDKPIPSTLDGNDLYSQGMYLVWREIHGYNTFTMVEFPTGAHFYWEFGWPGVVILSLVSGLYVGLCVYFFGKIGFFAIPLLLGIFKPWGFVEPKIWVSDIVLQFYQIILPLILLVLLFKLFHLVNNLVLKKNN
jgi:hypothetical protein